MRSSAFHTARSLRVAASLGLFVVCTAAAAGAAEVEPYDARIVTLGGPVHSGPGENYYRTDTLAQGETVEVYRERPGGWLGIRPPADSFSWIFGRHLKLLDNGLAEIDKDDVPSRIGSRLGEQRNAVQVRLKKGEVVAILGENTVGGETWYRIAPPSGEFRWIHARNVARLSASTGDASAIHSPPVEPAITVAPEEPAEFTAPSGPIEPTLPPIVTVPVASEAAASADRGVSLAAEARPVGDGNVDPKWRSSPAPSATASSPSTTPAASPPESTSLPAKPVPTGASPADVTSQAADGSTNNPPPPSISPATPLLHAAVDNGLARQLTDVELRLSRIVAQPPTTWQIAPLRQEASQLLAAAETDGERAAVNTTIAKLDRFAAIAEKYSQAAASAGSGDPRTTASLTDPQHLSPDTLRYDAVGILRPVVSKRPGAPQFALVDERGAVAAFVTPTPDLNLQPYLGHRIGITGSRGYIPEFQRAHVTAGRVSPLNERMLR